MFQRKATWNHPSEQFPQENYYYQENTLHRVQSNHQPSKISKVYTKNMLFVKIISFHFIDFYWILKNRTLGREIQKNNYFNDFIKLTSRGRCKVVATMKTSRAYVNTQYLLKLLFFYFKNSEVFFVRSQLERGDFSADQHIDCEPFTKMD